MPLPRVRFTVRHMMVAVAVVGTFFGIGIPCHERRARFRAIADGYFDRFLAIGDEVIRGEYEGKEGLHERRLNYVMAMHRKYSRAALYPFLPVATDPPEPE